MGLLFGSYECFYENEYSDYSENHTCYAFNIIRRKYLARYARGHIWAIGHQYGIDNQECSEAYDDCSHYEIFDFHG